MRWHARMAHLNRMYFSKLRSVAGSVPAINVKEVEEVCAVCCIAKHLRKSFNQFCTRARRVLKLFM